MRKSDNGDNRDSADNVHLTHYPHYHMFAYALHRRPISVDRLFVIVFYLTTRWRLELPLFYAFAGQLRTNFARWRIVNGIIDGFECNYMF